MSESISGGSTSTGIETESLGSSEATTAPDTTTTTATTDPTTGSTDPTTGSSTGDGLANGEACTFNNECASGNCFMAGILGGICGECLDDADCDWGCSLPNPLAEPPTGSVCGDGGTGSGCEDDDACDELLCNTVLDIPGVLTASTCGECVDDDDCGAQLCSPNIDVASIGGQWECVGAGTLANGEFCDFNGTGDQACNSGHCSVADIMGLVEFGVCSDCSNFNVPDEGCGAGETCEDPEVELDGTVTAGTCV